MADRVAPEVLPQLLDYDPSTGAFVWKVRGTEWFAAGKDGAAANAAKWNARFAGKAALNSESASHGYLDGAVLGCGVLAHRVAFAITHGRWPNGVDHIDGDRRNNRAVNLREVDQAENMRNTKRRADNPVGIAGVRRLRSGKLRAFIKRAGVQEDLGTFGSIDAAASARKAAEQRLGFHPNHGRA